MKRIDSTTPKKQHYVPQFILKNFRTGKKKRVHVYDKQRKIAYTSAVRDAACETGYYNIEIDGQGYTLEDKLSSLEGITGNIVKKIIDNESLAGLETKELAFFHLFCAVQLLRTETQRNLGKQIQETTLTWLEKRGIAVEDVENFEVFDEEKQKHSHIRNINSMALKLVEHFKDKVMMLVKAPRGCEFLISDNPITMHNHTPRPGRGNLGLGLDGIEVHMPLSRSLCVTYVCPKMMKDIVERVNQLNDRQLTKQTAIGSLTAVQFSGPEVGFQCKVPVGTIMTIIGPAPKRLPLFFYADRYFVRMDPDLSRGLDVVFELNRGIEGNLDGLNPELFERQ